MSTGTSKRKLIGAGVTGAVVAGLLGAGLVLGPASGQEATSDDPSTTVAAPAIETVAIERGSLQETKESVGSIGHGDAWAAPIEPEGVVTQRHPQGAVVKHGEPLIWVANRPVFLAEGDTPMYRTLAFERGADKKYMNGDDVRQLQDFLIDAGFDDNERLEADGIFGIGTKRAVKAWQKENGLEQSGTVDRSQMMFHQTDVRIDSEAQVGASFGELTITAAEQTISASFDTKSRGFLEEGATVSLDLGDGDPVDGVISKVEVEVSNEGTRSISVEIDPQTPIPADVERVSITVSRDAATDVLIVPVRAILALAGGGYAVELDGPSGPALTRVELGSVVDDVAEISGEISEGDEVVIPADIFGGDS